MASSSFWTSRGVRDTIRSVNRQLLLLAAVRCATFCTFNSSGHLKARVPLPGPSCCYPGRCTSQRCHRLLTWVGGGYRALLHIAFGWVRGLYSTSTGNITSVSWLHHAASGRFPAWSPRPPARRREVRGPWALILRLTMGDGLFATQVEKVLLSSVSPDASVFPNGNGENG